MQVVLCDRIELRAEILEKRLAEAVHSAQRRAQVVRHRVGESLEFTIGCSEFDGAMLDAPLQGGVDFFQQLLGFILHIDVGAGADPLLDLAFGVQNWNAAHGKAMIDAIMTAQPELDLIKRPVGQGSFP